MTDKPDTAAIAAAIGLDLTPTQLAELEEASGHLRHMLSCMPYPRGYADEPAHVFRPLADRDGAR